MNRLPTGYETARVQELDPVVRLCLNEIPQRAAWPLYIHGPVGTGKTCAAAILYAAAGRNPVWSRADDLLLSMSFGRASGVRLEQLNIWKERRGVTLPWQRFVERMQATSGLFLDDLAVRSPTEAMCQGLFDLLEWRKGRPVVITSNKSLNELAALYDDRIVSRLTAGTILEMTGDDRRSGTGYRLTAETS